MPFVKNDTRINRGGRPVGSKNNATKEVSGTYRKQLRAIRRRLKDTKSK